MPEQRRTIGAVLNKMIERLNASMRRLRILEQESSIYKTRLTSAEQELLSQRNHMSKSIQEVNDKIALLDESLLTIENTLKEIIEQLKKVTTTTRIKELEEMIEIFNPLKSQFITREEAERLIDQRLKE